MTALDGWWPYVFIAVAGWLATDIWRWLGVLTGNRLREDSEALNWVRAVATALVAAVVAKLIVYPTGVLEASPLWLRLGSVTVGAAAFFAAGQRPAVGIGTSITALAVGLYMLGF
ncbi:MULTISPECIES: AzlD domain-containing protein [unclassified Rhizobium]|uniref:AzlD domain-containing protein n=1 Tax=unclassified Rhizobium TaxID=2613769 RepID=UPI0006FF9D2B|nr:MULTISPECIES: AzlD domain-containing protein [unclassified Rhizobium]KQV33049.1 branched-chain amino acid transport [Rhizobium sp. Root1212]KRD21509.1 branched-chain amino acid transport [Rhizobium sp. Root268]